MKNPVNGILDRSFLVKLSSREVFELLVIVALMFARGPQIAAQSIPSTDKASQGHQITRNILVTSIPDSSALYIDSVYAGKTPVQTRLASGMHEIYCVPPDTMYEPSRGPYYLGQVNTLQVINLRCIRRFVSVTCLSSATGDELFFDTVGTRLPMDSAVLLHYGTYSFGGRNLQTNREVHQTVFLMPEFDYALKAKLGYFSLKPLVYSLVIPGLGQLSDNAYIEAAGFFFGTVGAALFYSSATRAYTNRHTEYDNVLKVYANASTESEAVALHRQADQIYSQLDHDKKVQHASVAVFIGVYLGNLLDVALLHLHDDEIQVVANAPGPRKVGALKESDVTLTMRFKIFNP